MLPAPVLSCRIVIVTSVLPDDTVPDPNRLPPFSASYTFITWPDEIPDTCTVSATPTLLLTIILSESNLSDTLSAE